MRVVILSVALLCGLYWMGCPDEGNGDETRAGLGAACVLNTDCEVGLLCQEGLCVAPGTGDGDPADTPDSGQSTNENTENSSDAGVDPDPDPNPNPFASNGRAWLLSIDNGSNELLKIDVETGEHRGACPMAVSHFYVSTTFGINGILYASKAEDDILERINPCTCEVTEIGHTGYGLIPGITANGTKIETIYGLETTADVLLDLDVETGRGTEVGDTMVNFAMSGTTWSDDLPGLFAIDNVEDKLYTIDTETGRAFDIADLDADFHYVGIEWNPYDRKLYACTTYSGLGGATHNNDDIDPSTSGLGILYEVNPNTGETTFINSLPHACNNLAAPWTAVDCIDELVVVGEVDAGAGE